MTEAVEQGLGVAQMSASTEVYVRDDMPPNVSLVECWGGQVQKIDGGACWNWNA